MTKVVDGDGLTPQEAQACVYRAQGLSQSDAYRRAFNVKRIKPETVWNKASERGVVERNHALAAGLCPKIAAGPCELGPSRSFKQEPIEWH